MEQQNFSIMKRIKSFVPAFNGLKILIKAEHNSRIQLLAALCVLVASVLFRISAIEWVAVIFAIGFVFALELVNSAIENIADFVSPGKDESIKKIKDLAAAGVLVGAATSIIIGLIIFLPKIISLF